MKISAIYHSITANVKMTPFAYFRYYESIIIDKERGRSNYTETLKREAMKFIIRRSSTNKPFFLYWAPDSTHAPAYASNKFR